MTGNKANELTSEQRDGITAKDGLLWRNGKIIDLPEADAMARKHGFMYAEQLVKHLVEKEKRT